MATQQERYDEAMLAYSQGDYARAADQLRALLADAPADFDARLALGMACCRLGDYATAIAEGERAAALRPQEQLVHTNLSLFYMKAGDRTRAEHHALQAKVAGWKGKRPASGPEDAGALGVAAPKPQNIKVPGKLPAMPWKQPPAAPAAPDRTPTPS